MLFNNAVKSIPYHRPITHHKCIVTYRTNNYFNLKNKKIRKQLGKIKEIRVNRKTKRKDCFIQKTDDTHK